MSTSPSVPVALCPMCARVGYPVSDCVPCHQQVYCSTGGHSFDDALDICRYCPAPNDHERQP